MSKPKTLIDYMGSISFDTMEKLLNQLRSTKEFQEMKKPARKRLYSTVVESIDNIFKYAASNNSKIRRDQGAPMISVEKRGDQYAVTSGNLVMNDDIGDLIFKLDRVNQLDTEALKSLYEDVINQEAGADDKGAGLGLITMALRTEDDISYSFLYLDENHSFFKMQIIITG
ncbi:MAG: SiaB family protein kinase [Bacteroidota bacterium]